MCSIYSAYSATMSIVHCNTSCKSLRPDSSYHMFLTQLKGDSIYHKVCKTHPYTSIHCIITIPWVYFMLVIIFFKGTAGLFSSGWRWILQECNPGWEKCLIALILKLGVKKTTIYDLKTVTMSFEMAWGKKTSTSHWSQLWVLDQLCVGKEKPGECGCFREGGDTRCGGCGHPV